MSYPYPPPVRAPQNGFGTTALVLGIVGLLFSFLPLIGIIAWPLVILGLIFALAGFVRVSSGRADNRGTTIAGAVTSALGLLICFAWVFGMAAATGGTAATASGASAAGSSTIGTTTSGTVSRRGTTAAAPTPTTIPGSGTFLVGSEVTPGTYRSTGAQQGLFEFCSWSRLRDTSGGTTIDFGTANADEPMIVTIMPSDGAFKSSNCEGWTRIK